MIPDNLIGVCDYEERWVEEVGTIWVCIIHNQNSRHHGSNSRRLGDYIKIQEGSRLPCLALDPWPESKKENIMSEFIHVETTSTKRTLTMHLNPEQARELVECVSLTPVSRELFNALIAIRDGKTIIIHG
jgi:hypothetical protein